jgi:Rrf2 family protein
VEEYRSLRFKEVTMNSSSRFVVASHILAGMHCAQYIQGVTSVTSDFIAEGVNTNPVVIRRLLGQLREAGLVDSQAGSKGGFSLAKPTDQITLLDVYRATEQGTLFHFHYTEPNQECPVGCTIQESLQGICSEAESAVEGVLANKTIAMLVEDMMANPVFREKAEVAMASGMAPGN